MATTTSNAAVIQPDGHNTLRYAHQQEQRLVSQRRHEGRWVTLLLEAIYRLLGAVLEIKYIQPRFEMADETTIDAVQRIVTRAAFQALSRQAPTPPLGFVSGRQRNQQQQQHQEDYFFDPAAEREQYWFGGFLPFVGRLVRIGLLATLLFSISLASYLVLYSSVMPRYRAAEPLYFDYTGASMAYENRRLFAASDETTKNAKNVSSAIHREPRMESSFRQEAAKPDDCHTGPWAWVDLFAKHSSWEALEDSVVPAPKQHTRLLDQNRAYSIETILTLPETSKNRERAGMFGVVIELWSSNWTRKLAVSRRSVRFPHQSVWISNIRKSLCLLPLLIGALDETRRVLVPSFRHYVESPELPLVS